MKKSAIILCCSALALLLACGKKDKTFVEEYVSKKEKKIIISDGGKVIMDSIRNVESATDTFAASYSSRCTSTKYDNMRGFDPASEDDMDDNGMSRYMENNDEEGWD